MTNSATIYVITTGLAKTSKKCHERTNILFLVNNQSDALFHVFIYSFHLSTYFEHQVLIIRRSNCINTSSGVISLCK